MKTFLFLFLIIITLSAKDKLYFLPQQGYEAEKEITQLFSKAHDEIKIAIYSFTNKKFLKALKLAAKRGVKIKIVADYGSNKNQRYRSIIPILRKLRNTEVHLINGKGKGKYKGIMHVKLFIIDNRIVSFGSANYSYSAFHNNYEILYINDDWTFTRKFIKIFDKLFSFSK
jgi:phosphatidylserine/phosphatidylglycerophosphate/cardiolipin synthase-like enzyme